MLIGALIDAFARRRDPQGTDAWILPLASGFIAGEALVAIVLPILIIVGLLSA
jgi:hypothetical protein